MENATVDQILSSFFCATCVGKHAGTVARYQRIDAQLRRFLEASGHRYMDDDRVELLAMERSFQLQGASARIMRAEDLVHSLASFLYEPWLMTPPGDRRTQISQTSRLAQWLCSRGLIDSGRFSCALIDVRIAADNARNNYTKDPRLFTGFDGIDGAGGERPDRSEA